METLSIKAAPLLIRTRKEFGRSWLVYAEVVERSRGYTIKTPQRSFMFYTKKEATKFIMENQ